MRVIFYTAALVATLASVSNAVKLNDVLPTFYAQEAAAPAAAPVADAKKVEVADAKKVEECKAITKKEEAKAGVKAAVPAKGVKVQVNAATGEMSMETGEQVNTDTIKEAATQMTGKVGDIQKAMKTTEAQEEVANKMKDVVEKKAVEVAEVAEKEQKNKEKVD